MKDHDALKIYNEYLVLEILKYYRVIGSSYSKREGPDFSTKTIGFEVTSSDPDRALDDYIEKISKNKLKVKNKKFEKLGGRVYRASDYDVLEYESQYDFDSNYKYFKRGREGQFFHPNESIKEKTKALNDKYVKNNKTLKHFYLGIFTTLVRPDTTDLELLEELNKLKTLPSKYRYEKIMIVTPWNVYIFDIKNNKYRTIRNIENVFNIIGDRLAKKYVHKN